VISKTGEVEHAEILENSADMPDLNKVQEVLVDIN
jgi:hypothetical protein